MPSDGVILIVSFLLAIITYLLFVIMRTIRDRTEHVPLIEFVNVRGFVHGDIREFVMARDACVCRYCGEHLLDHEVQIDHVYPVWAGGKSLTENLVVACAKCNIRKSNRIGIWPRGLVEFKNDKANLSTLEDLSELVVIPEKPEVPKELGPRLTKENKVEPQIVLAVAVLLVKNGFTLSEHITGLSTNVYNGVRAEFVRLKWAEWRKEQFHQQGVRITELGKTGLAKLVQEKTKRD